jgi:hypothetical protein
MLLRGRSETDELLVMRFLNIRMELNAKDKFHYLNLKKDMKGR